MLRPSICLLALFSFILLGGCSLSSDQTSQRASSWRDRSTGIPSLFSTTPTTRKDSARSVPDVQDRSVGSLMSPIPRTGQPKSTESGEVAEGKRKSEGSSPGSSSASASLSEKMIISELQSTWGKLSPEELVEQLEKGLYKEEVKAILNSASVVEVVNPWGKVWVMGSDTPPVFFDVRGRLIDWGWFEYHNLVADLDPAGDSLVPPIRIVKQPSLNDIMPLPKGDTSF
jgi:hypothetical protein